MDGFLGVELGIPCIPEWGAVVEDLEEVSEATRDDEFKWGVILAGDAGDISVRVEADDPVLIFEFAIADFEPGEIGRRFAAESGDGDAIVGVARSGENQLGFSKLLDLLNRQHFGAADDALDILVGLMACFGLGFEVGLVVQSNGVVQMT